MNDDDVIELVEGLKREGRLRGVHTVGGLTGVRFEPSPANDDHGEGERNDDSEGRPVYGPWPDKRTDPGAWMLLEGVKEFARMIFEKEGAIRMPLVEFWCERDPMTCKLLDTPGTMLCPVDPDLMESRASKGQLRTWMHRIARRSDAFGFALIHEAWEVSGPEAERVRKANESIAEHPDRSEVVLIIAEHAAWGDGSRVVRAPITRDAEGRPSLGEWKERDRIVGRFAGVLPTSEHRARAAEALAMLAELASHGWPKRRQMHQVRTVRDKARREGDSAMAEHAEYLLQRLEEMDIP